MDGAVFRGHKVVVSRVVDGEVNRETTGIDKGHTGPLLLIDGTSVDILLIWISLTLKLLQIAVLEALLLGPLDDATITRD